jgi:FkbM family methyltransferase
MSLAELRYEFIRTPLEEPLLRLRYAFGWIERLRHPELGEIHHEDARIARVVDRVLDESSSCIDIGCHYGAMLSRFCRRAPRGRHVAFEVVPHKIRFLRRKFPDVEVRQLALSDRAGQTRFFVCSHLSGFSSLARPYRRKAEEITVETARLDDVLPADRRVDFVKLDVEGAELLVLRGAAATLARCRPILVFDLYDFVTGLEGYSVFTLKAFLDGGGPIDRDGFTSACTRYPFTAFNWVAAPAGRAGVS